MILESCFCGIFECDLVVGNEKTQIIINDKKVEYPFLFPITQNDGCLFDKTSNYMLTEMYENGKVIVKEVRFKIYYIELYKNDFVKALLEFDEINSVAYQSVLMKDAAIKAFFNILDISIKSYNKAYDYVNHAPYSGFQGTFRQYCGLE